MKNHSPLNGILYRFLDDHLGPLVLEDMPVPLLSLILFITLFVPVVLIGGVVTGVVWLFSGINLMHSCYGTQDFRGYCWKCPCVKGRLPKKDKEKK